ncbi:hypothetical protein ACOME3_008339 [Neoechinorhynchus agilis]
MKNNKNEQFIEQRKSRNDKWAIGTKANRTAIISDRLWRSNFVRERIPNEKCPVKSTCVPIEPAIFERERKRERMNNETGVIAASPDSKPAKTPVVVRVTAKRGTLRRSAKETKINGKEICNMCQSIMTFIDRKSFGIIKVYFW